MGASHNDVRACVQGDATLIAPAPNPFASSDRPIVIYSRFLIQLQECSDSPEAPTAFGICFLSGLRNEWHILEKEGCNHSERREDQKRDKAMLWRLSQRLPEKRHQSFPMKGQHYKRQHKHDCSGHGFWHKGIMSPHQMRRNSNDHLNNQ